MADDTTTDIYTSLCSYACQGNLKGIYDLTNKCGDPDILKSPLGYTALCEASAGGHIRIIKYLMKKGVNVESRSDSALIYAGRNGHVSVIDFLIKRGASRYDQDGYYDTLKIALMNGHLDVFRYFIAEKYPVCYNEAIRFTYDGGFVDVAKKLIDEYCLYNNDLSNSMIYFAKNGKCDMIEYLLNKSKRIEQYMAKYVSVVLSAISCGCISIIKLFVGKGLDVSLDNNCFIKHASQCAKERTVMYLYENGADVSVFRAGDLRCATKNGLEDLVKLIIEHGTYDIKEIDYALIIAMNNGYYNISNYLLDKGADIELLNIPEFIKAYQKGKTGTVKLFLKRKIKIDNKILTDALVHAAYDGYFKMAELLIENNVDIHCHCDVIIVMASKNNDIEFIQKLIDLNVDVNAYNGYALYMASREGHMNIVKLLVQNGVYIDAQGSSSIKMAADKGYDDIALFLYENGASSDNLTLEQKKRLGINELRVYDKPDGFPAFRNTYECPISQIKFTDDIKKIGCSKCLNVFERTSLEEWLETGQDKCPMCRAVSVFYYA